MPLLNPFARGPPQSISTDDMLELHTPSESKITLFLTLMSREIQTGQIVSSKEVKWKGRSQYLSE